MKKLLDHGSRNFVEWLRYNRNYCIKWKNKKIFQSQLSDAFLTSYPSEIHYFLEQDLNIIQKSPQKLFGEKIKSTMYLDMFLNLFLVEYYYVNMEMELLDHGMMLDQARPHCKKKKLKQAIQHLKLQQQQVKFNVIFKQLRSRTKKSSRKRWYDPGYTEAGFPQKDPFGYFEKPTSKCRSLRRVSL